MPLQVSGKSASSTNPTTWTDFLTAEGAYLTNTFDGVGFVFDGSDGLFGVDLDDCFDDATNKFISPEHEQIAGKIEGYMEISPSGTGVKILPSRRHPSRTSTTKRASRPTARAGTSPSPATRYPATYPPRHRT
jgi:primase-polymerase (primpol)-like protein